MDFPTRVLVAETITTDLILGRDFLKKHNCSVELGERNMLHFNQQGVKMSLESDKVAGEIACAVVTVEEAFCVPPLSEMEVMGRVLQLSSVSITAWLVEPEEESKRSQIIVARAVVIPDERRVPVRLLNPRNEPVNLRKGDQIAVMEPLPVDIINIVAVVDDATVPRASLLTDSFQV